MLRPGVDGLTLIDWTDDDDERVPVCDYCGGEETSGQTGEVVRDHQTGEARHRRCCGRRAA